MPFTIKLTDETIQIEGRTHKIAVVKHLMSRRRSILSTRDPARADAIFAALPKKVVVAGGGASKSYRVKWEKVGKTKFPGTRFVFPVEESRLGRLFPFR